MKGVSYIFTTIDKERCISLAPNMVFRREVFKKVGLFEQIYAFNSFDFNMWFKIAFSFDVFFIEKILFEYTIHRSQMSQRHWRTSESPSGPIGMAIEIIGAISGILSSQPRESLNLKYISKKLSSLNKRLAGLIKVQIPDL
jgi:hypothetical protein